MKYFRINTDQKSLPGSPHKLWFEHSIATTGGSEPYGEKLSRLAGDNTIVFMYVNARGIVGVGRVLDSTWDKKVYDPPLVYVDPKLPEYRVRVLWFLDLQTNPIPSRILKEMGLSFPHAVTEISEIIGKSLLRMAGRRFIAAQGRAHYGSSEADLLDPEIAARAYVEGRRVQMTINRYERDPAARKACLDHFGTRCVACQMSFGEVYGPDAEGVYPCSS